MNRSIFCGLVLAASIFGACAQQKKAATAGTETKAPGIRSIEMHRTACFGKCPDYLLKIDANGMATYTGRTNAPYQGTYEKKLDSKKVAELFANFNRYQVDTCSEKYKTIPDLAGLNYSIDYGDKGEKTINNANSPFAPKFLQGLGERMDKLAPIDGSWKKVADAPKKD